MQYVKRFPIKFLNAEYVFEVHSIIWKKSSPGADCGLIVIDHCSWIKETDFYEADKTGANCLSPYRKVFRPGIKFWARAFDVKIAFYFCSNGPIKDFR